MTTSPMSSVLTLTVIVATIFSAIAVKVTPKTDLSKSSFTQEEKDMILQVHNSYRSLVDPTASDMIEVVWDNTIADYAQEWANNCVYEHRPNPSVGSYSVLGENLYYTTGTQYHEAEAIELWYDESKFYTYSSHKCTGLTCGHYVQLAWASTTHIGCGIKRCQVLDQGPSEPAYFIVCNYNKIVLTGQKPYVSGTSCSACPSEFPTCRHRLCVSQSMFTSGRGFDGNTTVTGLNADDGAGNITAPLFLILIQLSIVLIHMV